MRGLARLVQDPHTAHCVSHLDDNPKVYEHLAVVSQCFGTVPSGGTTERLLPVNP
jgi:hypothetical protein